MDIRGLLGVRNGVIGNALTSDGGVRHLLDGSRERVREKRRGRVVEGTDTRGEGEMARIGRMGSRSNAELVDRTAGVCDRNREHRFRHLPLLVK